MFACGGVYWSKRNAHINPSECKLPGELWLFWFLSLIFFLFCADTHDPKNKNVKPVLLTSIWRICFISLAALPPPLNVCSPFCLMESVESRRERLLLENKRIFSIKSPQKNLNLLGLLYWGQKQVAPFKVALELVKTLTYKLLYFYAVFSFYKNLIFIDLNHIHHSHQLSHFGLHQPGFYIGASALFRMSLLCTVNCLQPYQITWIIYEK